ncbi:uncharacterized protein LOC100665504 isoform X3 [Loxodonta africana]|uniref:uncharacterized protein LOC100665504 isoform X3 n=1 Tax=Loxodonta africana TaxID=9785 RepID=UPI0030D3AE77
MQPLEVGLVPTPTREPRLTRWLRRGSGILAHLVALGFTVFLSMLSRPGTTGPLMENTSRGARPRFFPSHQPVLFDSQVYFPGTLYSWPWRSASVWLRPSYSSRLSTPHSSSAPARVESGSTGRVKPWPSFVQPWAWASSSPVGPAVSCLTWCPGTAG